MDRKEYALKIRINNRDLSRVIIDQYYADKHADSVDDQTILELVKTLDGEVFLIEAERGDFQYFTAEPVFKRRCSL